MLFIAGLDAGPYQRSLCRRAMVHQVDQRQRRFALAQIIPDILADRIGIARIIQHIVDQLKRGADRAAIFRSGTNPGVTGAGDQGADLGFRFEQYCSY